ncbi:MAG: hypothetical protein NT166_10455 [Candidatus Aminicenantes bacterium]|nr:hypothetical protein [Candidatus Aminicenantes bacterium]
MFIDGIEGPPDGVMFVPFDGRFIPGQMNCPGAVFVFRYPEGIEEIDGLEDGFKVMVAVRTFPQDFQAQVDFGKGFQLGHRLNNRQW